MDRQLSPANLSASQARDMVWTSGTYGRIGSILYGQSDLRQCLVNRLKQRLTTGGSTLFKMTRKEKVTPSRQSVSLLRASGQPHIRQRLWFVADSDKLR